MADNLKWFKVYCSILADPDSLALGLWCRGLWVTLGLQVAQAGTGGSVTYPSKKVLFNFIRYQDNCNNTVTDEELEKRIKSLPNVTLIEDYGKVAVTFQKWRTYQLDVTVAERQQRYRDRKKDKEKRYGKTAVTGGKPAKSNNLEGGGRYGLREDKTRGDKTGVVVSDEEEKNRKALIRLGFSRERVDSLVVDYQPDRIRAVLKACTEKQPFNPVKWIEGAFEGGWEFNAKTISKGPTVPDAAETTKDLGDLRAAVEKAEAEERKRKELIAKIPSDEWERCKQLAKQSLEGFAVRSKVMVEIEALRIYQAAEHQKQEARA